MLSHDSGDIKNIENKLITTKIYTFETCRTIYILAALIAKYILSVKHYIFQVTTKRVDFLIDQDPYGQKLNDTIFRYGYKVFKNAEFHYQHLTYNILRLVLRGHLVIFFKVM